MSRILAVCGDDVLAAERSFEGYTIVSCGTLRRELMHLKDSGFLDADKILLTPPGLHERVRELEEHLVKRLSTAKEYSDRAIVIFGSRCYLHSTDPRDVDDIIDEAGGDARRTDAKNCVDMLTDAEERERLSGGQKVYWLPPGWFEYWRIIFKDWDKGMANETFPQHDKAIMLDSLGVFEEYSLNSPEKILEFSDWMGIPLEPGEISLERFKSLLLECLER